MTQHTHPEHVEGCFRCELSKDELTDAEEERENLRDVLTDLVDFTDRHRLSYDDHEHDCYQEWALLRDEARALLDDRTETT
jgi:hypothetical protein